MINEEKKYRLSFLDFKNLSDFIKTNNRIDLSTFAYSITKRRIEDYLAQYKISDYKSIEDILQKDKFKASFFNYLIVPTTEMFRDFEFWQKLKYRLIPKLKIKDELRIWVPDISSDDELMSLLIVLNEAGFDNNFEIIATSPYPVKFDETSSLGIDQKKYEISKTNYKAYNAAGDFDSYFVNFNKLYNLKKDLLINVKFKKLSLINDFIQESYFDIVLFRNRLIYYNTKGQKKALDKIYSSMKTKAFLILGVKEQFGDWTNKDRFSNFEKDCNIFIKKK